MAVRGDLSIWELETFGQELVDLTIGELVDQNAAAFPQQEALVYRYPELGLDLRLTYSDLRSRVDAIARGLMALGVQAGSKVAVLATNVPQWVLLELALPKIGAVLVTVNTNSRRAELEYLLRHADVHTLVMMQCYRGNDYLASMLELVPEMASRNHPFEPIASAEFPALKQVVFIEEDTPKGRPSLQEVEELAARTSLKELKERQAAVKPQDVFQIQFTSGTTGNPKGAMITHHAAINNGRLFATRCGLSQTDRLVSAMPLFHTAGNVMEVFGVFSKGAALVKAISFDARKMLELVVAEKATILSAVPTMVIAMLEEHAAQGQVPQTSSLRCLISGGTPIPVPVMERVRTTFGAHPTIGFGMTEASPMVTGTLPEDSFELKSATVGIPLPFTEVKIVDAQGNVVPLGQSGELLIRGYLVMKGYYKMPEKTAETIDPDGWLHSGDLAVMDERGYLRIVGRIKDMVIRGGENVYPAEVETFLMQHPAIKQAQVVGVPDAYMGEETAAFIQLRESAELTEEGLRDYCKSRIARHKVPKYFRFVSEYPLTPSGKVKKYELRESLITEIDVPPIGSVAGTDSKMQ